MTISHRPDMQPQDLKPDIRFPPPLIFLGFAMLGIVADWALDLPPIPQGRELHWFGGAMAAAGLALIIISLGLFRASHENPEPWTPSATIIARGPYRHSRNPMYLAMMVIQAGAALWFASAGILFTLPLSLIAADRFIIAREERYLKARFGEAYARYCQRVRRWL